MMLDKDILLIAECSSGTCPKQEGIADFLSDTLGHHVHRFSSDEIAARLADRDFDITAYDFVLWHFSSPDTVAGVIAQEITRHSVPAILIDGEGFPLSKSLGLVEHDAAGDTVLFDGSELESGIYTAQVDGYGHVFHFLLQSKGFQRYAKKDESKVGLQFGQPFELDPTFEGHVHTVSLSGHWQKAFPYTRPLLAMGRYHGVPWGEDPEEESFEIDLEKVVALVDDRRRIVASGLFDWIEPYHPFDPSSYDPDDPTTWGADYYDQGSNRYWDFLHRMVMYITAACPSKAPVGQNIFSETDLIAPSRGFDFSIKRTYTSGTWNLNSYQSPSWTSNHDQYLIWDKFNDRVQLFNGTGRAVEMEMVQGDPVEFPADDNNQEPLGIRTFVSVNSGVTDIAIYHPPDNTDPLTRKNPSIGEYPRITYDEYVNIHT